VVVNPPDGVVKSLAGRPVVARGKGLTQLRHTVGGLEEDHAVLKNGLRDTRREHMNIEKVNVVGPKRRAEVGTQREERVVEFERLGVESIESDGNVDVALLVGSAGRAGAKQDREANRVRTEHRSDIRHGHSR